MHPNQPPIHWGGAIMWRGTTMGKPIRSGASFVGLGTHKQRVVFYPISHPDPNTGLAIINWIAEVTMDNAEGWKQSGWFRQVPASDFAHHFKDWTWDWFDVPELIANADSVFENPMIDRDPVPTWVDGPVALMGDAAHAMYPTGSNGGSQAIIDARALGTMMLEHGVTPEALAAYDAKLCGPISQLILRNRGAGPFGLLNLVDERCGGTFDNIDDVIPPKERTEFMAGYKAAAGFAIETLNKAPRTIAAGAQVRDIGSRDRLTPPSGKEPSKNLTPISPPSRHITWQRRATFSAIARSNCSGTTASSVNSLAPSAEMLVIRHWRCAPRSVRHVVVRLTTRRGCVRRSFCRASGSHACSDYRSRLNSPLSRCRQFEAGLPRVLAMPLTVLLHCNKTGGTVL